MLKVTNILSLNKALLLFTMLIFCRDQIYSQIPLIDTFSTSINFSDGLIDTSWNTVTAYQLLANGSDIMPEESDLSGHWKAGYNPENHLFYVLIEVKDDTITNEELIHLDSLYNADHITIYFDLFNDGFSYYNNGYFTFTLFPETDQYSGRIGPNSFSLGDYDYIDEIDKNITTDGWFVELLFSFENLLNNQEILFIDTIGFEAVISDNDKGFGEREHRLSWNDPNIDVWINPSLMQDIILDQKLNSPFYPNCTADFDYTILSKDEEGQTQISFTDHSTTNDEIINWSWEFGDDSYISIQNPNHTYNPLTANINACLFITTENGCNNSICNTIVIPPDRYSLKGKVNSSVNLSVDWTVVAFQQQGNQYIQVESLLLENKNFEFISLEEGNYLLYALPKEVDDNYFPTYFVNKYNWQRCDNIIVNGDVYDIDILLNSYSYNILGSGTISGNLQQADEGIPIILAGENGYPLKYILTDDLGNFNFDQLPFGFYLLYPEYPGLDNSGIMINLNTEQSNWNNIQFSNQVLTSNKNSIEIHSDYQINYHKKQKELLITTNNKYLNNTKIFIYNILGELLYFCQSGFIESKTIYTGNFNSYLLLIQIWDGETLFTEKILK